MEGAEAQDVGEELGSKQGLANRKSIVASCNSFQLARDRGGIQLFYNVIVDRIVSLTNCHAFSGPDR